MTPAQAYTLNQIFSKSPKILDRVKSGDTRGLKILLKTCGIKNVTQTDIQEAQDLASLFDSASEMSAQAEQQEDIERAKRDRAAKAYGDTVRGIMKASPKTMAIYAALNAASSGLRAISDNAANNGNRLAQAILAAARGNMTDRQIDTYGSSRMSNAQAWGQERMRRGENLGRWAKAASDAIDKTLGTYQADDRAARYRMMTPYDRELGMSGQYYNAAVQEEKLAEKMGRQPK